MGCARTPGIPTAHFPPEFRPRFGKARAREKHHWDAGIAGQQFFCQRLWTGMVRSAKRKQLPIRLQSQVSDLSTPR